MLNFPWKRSSFLKLREWFTDSTMYVHLGEVRTFHCFIIFKTLWNVHTCRLKKIPLFLNIHHAYSQNKCRIVHFAWSAYLHIRTFCVRSQKVYELFTILTRLPTLKKHISWWKKFSRVLFIMPKEKRVAISKVIFRRLK